MRGHLSTSGQGGGGERCCLPASAGVPKPSAPCGGWCARCWPHPQQPGGALGAAAFPPSGRVSGWRQIYRLLENGARVLPSPPHPTHPRCLHIHLSRDAGSEMSAGLRPSRSPSLHWDPMDALPPKGPSTAATGTAAKQGSQVQLHGPPGRPLIPLLRDHTSLPPEAWDGHSIYTHRAKTDVPEGVPASPHHPLGAPQKALGASEPIPTGP